MDASPNDSEERIDPEAFRRELQAIADHKGSPFGRVMDYWQYETEHLKEVRNRNEGTIMLFRTWQSLFLETVEQLNAHQKSISTPPRLTEYHRFVAEMVQLFQQLVASELIATYGYPMPSYTIVRNTVDQLILISAVMRGMTDFFTLDGSTDGEPLSREAKKVRRNADGNVRKEICSDLSEETAQALKEWNDCFDLEVHGAKLSFGCARGWLRGDEPLPVIPQYDDSKMAMFTNRLCEVTWMAHRLIPILQHSAMEFPSDWAHKWRRLDNRFKETIRHFATQQELTVGSAIIELVNNHFPFDAASRYPLEEKET